MELTDTNNLIGLFFESRNLDDCGVHEAEGVM